MCVFNVFSNWKRLILIAAACLVSTIQVAHADKITIGTISSEPVSEARTYRPFADYLASQLTDVGIDTVSVQIAVDIADAVEMLKRSEIDLFFDSSVTASVVNSLSGSKFLLRRWKKARGQYRSVVFVSLDSDVKQLEDLRGKTVAFEEPFSTSGYILPAVALLQSKLELSHLANTRIKPPTDKVGYVMANDNETQMAWLERDMVTAAAMAENDYESYQESALKLMRIIHTTPYVPYHVITYRAGLKQDIVRRVKEILLSAHETGTGKEILEQFERTSKFDEIPDTLLSEVTALLPFLPSLNTDR